jgi:hypothetical protein
MLAPAAAAAVVPQSGGESLGTFAVGWRRRLKGTNQLPKVIAGVRFKDGIEVIEASANHAA